MSMDRRKFLGLTAAGTLSLAGGSGLISRAEIEAKPSWLPSGESPLTAKRWAMVVDLRVCLEKEDRQALIDACHRTHNVPHFDNHKDEVKWVWEEKFEKAFPEQQHEFLPESLAEQPVLVFCNHCDNPPCTRVCPTGATWKREDGVVMMDWHRCIGCRYCIAACPYGSRSFNWRDPRPGIKEQVNDFPTRSRGVVEKCTFCEERLAKGQLPACVEACQHGGLVFGDLEDAESEVRTLLRERHALRRRPGLGTQPEVFYLIDDVPEATVEALLGGSEQ